MASFYPNLDILTIPSLNSTEAFGLVQIEAMVNGVPIIASNLPGVRQPVLRHKMGKIIPIGDSKALAQAVIDITENRKKYTHGFEKIQKQVIQKREVTLKIQYSDGMIKEISSVDTVKILEDFSK